jgi:hypothetical protein
MDYRPQSPDLSSLPQYETSPFFNADMARRSSRIAQSDNHPVYEPMPEAIHEPIEIQPVQAYEPTYEPKYEPVYEQKYDLSHEPVQPIPEPIAPMHAPAMEGIPSIEVKTKFPVARIKRIMQADEDVGKVAQVTPIAVCM